jgi:hypothetical protein
MAIPAAFARLKGEWTGTNRMWPAPQTPAQQSDTTALVATAAQNRFLTIGYTWAEDGHPQDGFILLGADAGGDAVEASWVDSWHMGDKLMTCQGELRNDIASVKGTYAAPPGPDWGWRIVVQPEGADAFMMTMYNVSPDGAEEKAVEARYTRNR